MTSTSTMRLSPLSFLPRVSTLVSGPRLLNVQPRLAVHSRLASTSSTEQPTPTAPAPAPAPAREQAEEQGHPKPKRPYSQLQRNVFALYRKAYRLIRTKPEDTQYHFLLYLRHAFKHPSQGGAVGRRDFSAIEHLLRRGERMVEQVFGDVGVRDVHLPGYVIEEVQREQARRASEKEEEAKGKPKR